MSTTDGKNTKKNNHQEVENINNEDCEALVGGALKGRLEQNHFCSQNLLSASACYDKLEQLRD